MKDFASMKTEQIEARMAQIAQEIEKDDADLDALEAEARAIKEELEKRKKEAEKRRLIRDAVSNGAGTVITKLGQEERQMEKKTYGVDSAEYRDAFYAMIAGTATTEQRTIVMDSTAPGNGDAIAIPKTLDEKIWDGIHTAHPILADVTTVRSGIAIEVTKHTGITTRTTKKLDSASNSGEEENTFVKVVLYGYDYEKYVNLTYAEAKMSQGALENYLAEEISAEIGEALAKDVFAQIESDATTAQKVTATENLFADIKSAMALAILANAPVIYAPASSYYNIVGAENSAGVPFNIANTLGCPVKLDNAAAHITVVDPKMFLLNEVQSIMIESERDVKNHKVCVSGYLRAQGTMRKNKAAAYIA